MTVTPPEHTAALALIWNRLHHNAWETYRTKRDIGSHSPRNPYTPRITTATIHKCDALDTTITTTTSRMLGSVWPEEHPGLLAPIAVELTRETHDRWTQALDPHDRATWEAATQVWPHAYDRKINRHGNTRLRTLAPHEAILTGLNLVALANVRAFDPADLEPAYISEGDLQELERLVGTQRSANVVNPTQ